MVTSADNFIWQQSIFAGQSVDNDAAMFFAQPERHLIARPATVSETEALSGANATILVASDNRGDMRAYVGILARLFEVYPRPHVSGVIWIDHDEDAGLFLAGIPIRTSAEPSSLSDEELRDLLYRGTCCS